MTILSNNYDKKVENVPDSIILPIEYLLSYN